MSSFSCDFSKAKTVVSFGYDFLGSSFNHTLFNKQFTSQRVVNREKREMSRLYTFESNLSLTGANSDHRIPIRTSHSKIYIPELWNILNSKIGSTNNVVLTILSQPEKEANVSVYSPVTK